MEQLDAEFTGVEACPTCGGQGWVRRDVPVGHPDFGRAFPCLCQMQRSETSRLARLQRYSNLGVLHAVTFETLAPSGPGIGPEANARYDAALRAAQAFVEQPAGSLLLTGGHGTGKTCLAAAAANRLMAQGHPVLFTFVPDLLDQLRGGYADDSALPHDELLEQVKNVPVLVLDDIGAHNGTPWAEEKLFQVVNHRYLNGLPTVLTSAVPLERLDGRLQSKLTDPRTARAIDMGGSVGAKTANLGSIPGAMLRDMTFPSFEPKGRDRMRMDSEGLALTREDRETLAAALYASRAFAEDPDGWLLLIGGPGCGKTHLAVAVANQQLAQGNNVFFASASDILDHLRYTFGPDSRVTYDEMFDRIKQAPLLILDDLGRASATEWANEKLYQIIVHRHNARLPTIITMQTPKEGPANRDALSDRIASRLSDNRIVTEVPITAPDYRQTGRDRREPRKYRDL